MKYRYKLSFSILLVFVWSVILTYTTRLLNYPNDAIVFVGIIVVLASFLVFPVVIWKISCASGKKKENETVEPPTAA